MSNVLVDKNKIDILANAISVKSGEPVTMTLDEMVEAVDGIEQGIFPTGNIDIESAGVTDVTNYATATVPQGEIYVNPPYGRFKTVSNAIKWEAINGGGIIEGDDYGHAGYVADETWEEVTWEYDAVPSGTTVTPTESAQTIGGANYMMEGAVTVNAIPSNYVGSGITQRSSSDLTASGATVTAPAGYYASSASKAVASGTVYTPTATKGVVSGNTISITPSVGYQSGYIEAGGKSGTAVSVSASELVSGTLSVTSSGTKDVTNYASASIPSGTEGTPTATKGTASNHSISITPSVTNTAGYITGGTKTGTAVTVSASELASGNKEITSNGTNIDVVGYSTVSVNVSGGGGSSVQIGTGSGTAGTPNASTLTFANLAGEPTSYAVFYGDTINTSSTVTVAGLAYDGTNIHGQGITNTNNAQVSYLDDTYFTASYSSGTLTITASNCVFSTAYPYGIFYSYGGSSTNIGTEDVQVGSGATSITFTGLTDEPEYFSCIFKSNFSTSSGYQRVIEVVCDGTNIYGLEMDSSAKYASHWTYSYSNGSLTITSQGTNSGGYFHQPGYYQLTYAVGGEASPYQAKTVTPTTSQQVVTPDTGYDALSQVTVNAIPSTYVQPTSTIGSTTYRASTSNQTIASGTYHSANATIAAVSQTNLSAENIKSGTTISISNGQSNIWSVTGTYTGGGGGSATVASTTWTNSSNTATTHQFTSLSGTPKAAFLRCTTSLSRSSSSSNYFIADMVWNGTSCVGNSFRRSNGTYANVTSGYSVTTGTNSITFTSNGSSTTNPGSFYNGTYELVYIY